MGRQDERGAAAVELGLILPLLVLLLMGIIEFGRGYNARVTLSAAVREGARSLALGSGDPVAVTQAAAVGLDESEVVVTLGECVPGQPAEVTAEYPMTYSIPFFGEGTWNISATGAMRCGG